MNALTFLASMTGGALALNLLGEVTRWANDYVKRPSERAAEPREPAEVRCSTPKEEPQKEPYAKEETAAWWWRQVLSVKGIFGLLLCPLQVPILLVNSYIIALNLETIFQFAPPPLFWFRALGWEREVTIVDLYGLLCSLGQMISASIYQQMRLDEEKPNTRLRNRVGTMAATALISLMAFEVGSSLYRGRIQAGLENAVLSGLLALGVAAVEVLVGIYLIDWFLVPLILAFLPVAAPFRAVARCGESLKQSFQDRFRQRKSSRANPLILAVACPLAAIERAVMQPLRRLDALILRLMLTRKPRSSQGHQDSVRTYLKAAAVGILLVAAGVALLGCGNFGAPKPSIQWITALDNTTSIKKDHYIKMRDEMMPEIVLSRLRSRDDIHILPVDSDPEQNVKVIPMSNRRAGVHTEIAAVFDYLRTFNQPQGYRGTTNIGGVLAYAKRISQKLEEERKRAEAIGRGHPSAPLFVVAIFTDGKLEGRQTRYGGEWPQNVVVWFFGVDPRYEDHLKKWATGEMGLPEEQLTIVRMSDWKTMKKVFGQRIDRPYEDQQVLQALGVPQAPVEVAGNKSQRRSQR